MVAHGVDADLEFSGKLLGNPPRHPAQDLQLAVRERRRRRSGSVAA